MSADPDELPRDRTATAPTPPWWPRAVLALGIAAGISAGVGLATTEPAQVGIATDVYYRAGEIALSGGDFYAFSLPGRPGFRFLYPPTAVVAFLPHALLGTPGLAYALQTVINLVAVGALGWLVVRTIERRRSLDTIDRILVVGYAVASAGMAESLVMGQVNPWLALGIAAGVTALERDRERAAGAALACVAFVKLFPALVGAWLLRLRAWTAILAATATGVGLLLFGVVLFGTGPMETYVTVTLPAEASVGAFEAGPDPAAPFVTVRRQLAVVAPWIPSDWLLPAGIAVVSPVVLASYRTMERLCDRLVALQATLLGMLLVFPLEPFYLSLAVFPLVPLAYLLDPGRTRRLFLAGTLVVSVPVTMTTVEQWANFLGPGAGSLLLDVAGGAFSFALPTTVGVWLVLAACVHYQHRAVTGRSRGDD